MSKYYFVFCTDYICEQKEKEHFFFLFNAVRGQAMMYTYACPKIILDLRENFMKKAVIPLSCTIRGHVTRKIYMAFDCT